MVKFLPLICSFLFLAAFTLSAPGTPNRSPRPGSLGLDEVASGLSSPAVIEKRAISIGPPYIPGPVRYVAFFWDRSGNIRILMPTRITADLWNYIPQGSKAQSVATSVIHGFLYDPVLSRLKNWDVVQQYAKITFGNVNELFLAPLVGAVVNLCIDINVLPILYSQVRNLPVGTSAMDFWMFNFIQHFLTPYYMGSPSKAIISLDPRAVSVESFQVPNAKDVANAITYIFSYQTPPLGSPSKTINKTYNKNLTITGNSTQVPTLKMPSSTSHLETNITKRASVTCQDNYPNILSFLQSGPMTTVGTNTISCAV